MLNNSESIDSCRNSNICSPGEIRANLSTDDSVKPAGIHQGGSFFPELESIRGIAILLVFIYHILTLAFSTRPDLDLMAYCPIDLFHEGHTGVSLFLVLSAFLLSMPYWKYLQCRGTRPIATVFYYRRALRILPLYYSAVLVSALVVQAWHAILRASAF
jgi:peptidoglycan/LPS O-acetylase OafA/YrhL